jgi:hypothetical protein
MYTQEMAEEFHKVAAPEGFYVDLYDSDNWITIVVDPNLLTGKTQEELQAIVDYINAAKVALENMGAIVLVTRDTLEE